MHRNEVLCRRWIDEVWNKRNDGVVDELLAEDCVAAYPYLAREENLLTGREQYRNFIRLLNDLFTDIRVEISDITADDEKVVAVCTFSGLPRALKEERVVLQSLCLYKIEGDRINQIWNNVEFSGVDLLRIANDAEV